MRMAALGSSFAAGPGIKPIADKAAGRSGRNYPSLLAASLGARLTDLTVSGATTTTILDRPQRTLGRSFPPQVDGVPRDSDLITVTAGGNDLGYIGSMMRLATAGRLSACRLSRPLGRRMARDGCPIVSSAQLEAAVVGLTRVVETARGRAPQARVILVDYLTVIGDNTTPGPEVPLTESELDGFRTIAAQLADAFAAATERTSAELVRASELSRVHGLGSAEPWTTGFHLSMRPAPFHPNLTGMRAVADAVYAVMIADAG